MGTTPWAARLHNIEKEQTTTDNKKGDIWYFGIYIPCLMDVYVDDVVELPECRGHQRGELGKVEALQIGLEPLHLGHVRLVQPVLHPHLSPTERPINTIPKVVSPIGGIGIGGEAFLSSAFSAWLQVASSRYCLYETVPNCNDGRNQNQMPPQQTRNQFLVSHGRQQLQDI